MRECLQRVAVTTAANMCRQLPSDAADFVTEAVPLLTNLLQYQDSKVRWVRVGDDVVSRSVCVGAICDWDAGAGGVIVIWS